MSIEELVDGIRDKYSTSVDSSTNGVDSIVLIEFMSKVGAILSTLAGILIYIILFFLPFIIALEIMYVCFPIVRKKYEDLNAKFKTHGVINRTLEFTLKDAVKAVVEAETVRTGKSALYVYLKIKLKSIIFIMVILGLFLLGTDTVVNFISNLFEGLFNVIENTLYRISI